MNEDRALALARRQGQLLERSARLRAQVAQDIQPLQHTLVQVDGVRARVLGGWEHLRAHPHLPLAAVGAVAALVLLLRPRRALGWAWRFTWRWGRRGLFAWQLWRRWGGAFVPGAEARGAAAPPGTAAATPLQPLIQLLAQAALRWARRFTTRR